MCECAHLSEPITAPGAHYSPSQTSPRCCLSAQQTPTHFPSCIWKAIFSDLPGWGWLHLISQLLHNSYIAPKWLLTNWGTFPKVSSTELTPHAVRCSMRKGLCEQIHLGNGTYDVPFLNSMHRTILRDTLLFCHTGTPESLLRKLYVTHLWILRAEREKLMGVFTYLLSPVLSGRPALCGTLLPSQRAQGALLSQKHESELRLPHASKWPVADFLANHLKSWHSAPHPLLSTWASESCLTLGLWHTTPWFFCLPGWRPLWVLTYRNRVTQATPSAWSLYRHPCLISLCKTRPLVPCRKHSLSGEQNSILVNFVFLYLQTLPTSFWPHPHIPRPPHFSPGWLQDGCLLPLFPLSFRSILFKRQIQSHHFPFTKPCSNFLLLSGSRPNLSVVETLLNSSALSRHLLIHMAQPHRNCLGP